LKINSSLVFELKRDGQFMTGSLTLNGIRQNLKVVPHGVEFSDLITFVENHVMPMIVAGQHGSIAYRKGKGIV